MIFEALGDHGHTIDSLRDQSGMVVGLALCDKPKLWEGPLQMLSMEERTLHELHGKMGGVFFHVRDFATLANSERAINASAEAAPHSRVFTLTNTCLARLLDVPTPSGLSVSEVLEAWRVEYGLPPALCLRSCLQLWAPLAFCMGVHRWSTIFLGHGMSVEKKGYCDQR